MTCSIIKAMAKEYGPGLFSLDSPNLAERWGSRLALIVAGLTAIVLATASPGVAFGIWSYQIVNNFIIGAGVGLLLGKALRTFGSTAPAH